MKITLSQILLAVVLFLSASTIFAREPLPVETFASLPLTQTARISPDGQYLATMVNVKGITHITTLKLGAAERPRSILSTDNKEFRISWFNWVNNDRLFVSVRYPRKSFGTDLLEVELYGVNKDGSDMSTLLDLRGAKWVPQIRDKVVDFLPDEPDHVLMELDMKEPGKYDIFRVHVESGKRQRVQKARDKANGWFTDRQHRVRGYVKLDRGKVSVIVCDEKGKNWRTLWEYNFFSADQVSPMSFDHDPNVLYVRAYHEDRLAVFRVDLRDPELKKELVYSDPLYDVEGSLLYSLQRNKVVGLRNSRGDNVYTFWDQDLSDLAESIARALPSTKNNLLDFDRAENRYLLLASSPTHPGTFYFGDVKGRQLSPFGQSYPQLGQVNLSGKKAIEYKSSDGSLIDGYLTLPFDRKPGQKLPTIIFPHGGPAARTNTGFDYWTEFFADRGYAVLEMDFRGSSGRGFQWMSSAFTNWDQITQQDIADGARYVIEEGIADEQRICIVGASFGGYAAMMGAVKRGDLYKCAISIAGVGDLLELRNSRRRFMNSELMEGQIGSESKRLKAASPRFQAETISIPVLLIHGATDRVVPVNQSQEMYQVMTKLGKDVEYIEIETGDHYLSNHFDRIEVFKAMDRFLQANL